MIAGLGKVLLVVLIVYFEYLKNNLKTRKYPSRMRTARLPSVHASVSSPDVGTGWEAGPGGLMSKGEGAGGFHALCPGDSMSDVQRGGAEMEHLGMGG